MRDHINVLQEQVNELYGAINDLRNRQETCDAPPDIGHTQSHGRSMSMSASRTLPPLVSPSRAQPKPYQQFHGPTSSMYGIELGKSTLQTMGILQSTLDNDGMSRERSPMPSPMSALISPHPSKDPLWAIDHSEAVRMCRVYEEEIGIMYPILDIEETIRHINMLYTFIGSAIKTGFMQMSLPGTDAIDDENTTIVKMVLAITFMQEGNGKSDMGQRLYDSAKQTVNFKITCQPDIKSLIMLILTAIYHFHRDEEIQAWRFIGIAARLCIELGLHRKESLVRSFTNEAEYLHAIRVFWVTYALDRRWSFGTGMPFALQDADIDSNLPEPDDAFPYLKHITEYNHIAAKIWYFNAARESGETTKRDEVGFFDYQILQWYAQLPELLKFNSKDLLKENEFPGRGMRRLRFLMHLRKNQARISIYRPILHSATSIMEHRYNAQTVVDVAKDTIATITGVNKTSDLYSTQQVCYNYFLVQALAVVFLAVSHAPAEFCDQTRDEFYSAIDLIKGFSTKSYLSKRLWRTVRGLKEMGDKIGLMARGIDPNEQEQDAHSNAAVAMAGLAGHHIVNPPLYGTHSRANSFHELGVSPEDGQQIGIELTNLFEMAQGGFGNHGGPGTTPGPDAYTGFHGEIVGGEGMNSIFGNDQEFSRIMGELF
jgi:hypothetical protein